MSSEFARRVSSGFFLKKVIHADVALSKAVMVHVHYTRPSAHFINKNLTC